MILDKFPVTIGSSNDTEHDPHSWDDPESDGWRDRIKPSTPRRAALTGFVLTLVLTAALYTAHLFPAEQVLFVGLVISIVPLVWYKGRKSAFEDIRNLDFSAIFTGRTASFRYGQAESASDKEIRADEHHEDGYVFEPGRELDIRGNMKPLRIRDLFGDPSNVRGKMHRAGDDGDAPARDYLPENTTAKVETDTLGTIYITLSDGLERRDRAPDIDREATLPSTLTSQMVGAIKSEYESMTDVQLPAVARRAELQKKRADELSRPASERLNERLEIALDVMTASQRSEYQQRLQDRDQQERPGSMPSDAVEQYDERVSDQIDDQLDNDT